jgi:hypothetical protein
MAAHLWSPRAKSPPSRLFTHQGSTLLLRPNLKYEIKACRLVRPSYYASLLPPARQFPACSPASFSPIPAESGRPRLLLERGLLLRRLGEGAVVGGGLLWPRSAQRGPLLGKPLQNPVLPVLDGQAEGLVGDHPGREQAGLSRVNCRW